MEFTRLLGKICGANLIDSSGCIVVVDIMGKKQQAHMDSFDIRNVPAPLAPLVDRKRLSSPHNLPDWAVTTPPTFVIPTLSFVVYFNDVGGCTFPHAEMANKTIQGKRGRIIMFGNYIDSQRPSHDTTAMHFGTYDGKTKRIMTMGMLSDRMPAKLLGRSHDPEGTVRGLLYTANKHNSNHQEVKPRVFSVTVVIVTAKAPQGVVVRLSMEEREDLGSLLPQLRTKYIFGPIKIGLGLLRKPGLKAQMKPGILGAKTFYCFPLASYDKENCRRMDVQDLLLHCGQSSVPVTVKLCERQDSRGLHIALQTPVEAACQEFDGIPAGMRVIVATPGVLIDALMAGCRLDCLVLDRQMKDLDQKPSCNHPLYGTGVNLISRLAAQLSANCALQRLRISGQRLGGRCRLDVGTLIAALQTNHVLKELDLRKNGITDSQAIDLANCLRTNRASALETLRLDCNPILPPGYEAMVAMAKVCTPVSHAPCIHPSTATKAAAHRSTCHRHCMTDFLLVQSNF